MKSNEEEERKRETTNKYLITKNYSDAYTDCYSGIRNIILIICLLCDKGGVYANTGEKGIYAHIYIFFSFISLIILFFPI